MTKNERVLYDLFCAMDNQDTPLEEWPARAIAALSQQGPVAYIAQCELDSLIDYRKTGRKAHGLLWSEPAGQAGVPLYAAPPEAR